MMNVEKMECLQIAGWKIGNAKVVFPLVLPSTEILDKFNRMCQPMLDRILSNHVESRTLATLRDTLLPKLLSGQLVIHLDAANMANAA